MTALAAQVVKWSALGNEALIALIGGVGVVVAYGFVVIGSTRMGIARREGHGGAAIGHLALAVVGGLICVAAIVLGIIAMTHKSS